MTTREQQEYMGNLREQLEYDICCLGDDEIRVLHRIIHGYLISQGVFEEPDTDSWEEKRYTLS